MEPSQVKSLRIIVKGRVQGVGFRYFTLNEARLYGICGYVRNLADGSVEIEAEGLAETMEMFLERVSQGPGYSCVEDLSREEIPFKKYSNFTVTY